MDEPTTAAPARLSRTSRGAILAFCVALFLVGRGPIWRHAFSPDASILWSYAPIPALVLVALLLERKLRLSSLLVESLLLAILKFGITATILVSIWAFSTPPPVRREAPRATAPLPAVRPDAALPRPTPIPERLTGVLEGRVTFAEGKPASGALVWVSSGLEAYRFPLPGGRPEVRVGSRAFEPALLPVRVDQRIDVLSSDGRLHTLDVRAAGETLANVAVLANGLPRGLVLMKPAGLVALRCDLHPEERGALLVLAHPFFATADAEGRFELRGVPAGPLELSAVIGNGPPAAVRVALPAGSRADVGIAFSY